MDLDNTWKFLKNINSMNKETYKTFAPLFESIKRKSKKREHGPLLKKPQVPKNCLEIYPQKAWL